MPTQWAHNYLWRARANPVVTPPPQLGGYPLRQAIAIGSLFGALHGVYDRLVWWAAWIGRLWRWSPSERAWMDARVDWVHRLRVAPVEHRLILGRVVALLEHPAYPVARASVKETAQTLGFNKPTVWAELGHEMRGELGTAENLWRHLRSVKRLHEQYPGLTNPEKHLLVELGYVGYAASPRTP